MEQLFEGLLNDHLGFVVWAAVAFFNTVVFTG
jgi:hypothetical protein